MGGPDPGGCIRYWPSIRRGGPGRENHPVRPPVRATRCVAQEPETGDDSARMVRHFRRNYFPRNVDQPGQPGSYLPCSEDAFFLVWSLSVAIRRLRSVESRSVTRLESMDLKQCAFIPHGWARGPCETQNPGHRVNEFYKKGCQEKTSPSTGGREDLCLEIQPTVCKRAPRFARKVLLWLVCHSLGFIFRWSPRQSSL